MQKSLLVAALLAVALTACNKPPEATVKMDAAKDSMSKAGDAAKDSAMKAGEAMKDVEIGRAHV